MELTIIEQISELKKCLSFLGDMSLIMIALALIVLLSLAIVKTQIDSLENAVHTKNTRKFIVSVLEYGIAFILVYLLNSVSYIFLKIECFKNPEKYGNIKYLYMTVLLIVCFFNIHVLARDSENTVFFVKKSIGIILNNMFFTLIYCLLPEIFSYLGILLIGFLREQVDKGNRPYAGLFLIVLSLVLWKMRAALENICSEDVIYEKEVPSPIIAGGKNEKDEIQGS